MISEGKLRSSARQRRASTPQGSTDLHIRPLRKSAARGFIEMRIGDFCRRTSRLVNIGVAVSAALVVAVLTDASLSNAANTSARGWSVRQTLQEIVVTVQKRVAGEFA